MASVGEGDCHKDPNFAVICSFFDKYSASLGLPEVSYTELQKYLEDTSTDVSNVLIDIHVRLLRRIGKSTVTPERFEKNIIKFIHHYSEFDAWEVESYGYKHAKLDTKLRILKNLLECQFDYNVKFKEKVNESSAEDMRFLPIGRDKEGQAYWYFLDKDMNLLVYKEEQDDDAANTWQLVCSDRQDLAKLVNALQNGDHNQNQDKDKPSPTDSQSSKDGSHDKELDKKEVSVKVEENGCGESTTGESKERFMEIKIHKCDLVEPTKQENQEPKAVGFVVVKKEVDEAGGFGVSPSKAKKSSTTSDKTTAIVTKAISDLADEKSFKDGVDECKSTVLAKVKAIEVNQFVEGVDATNVNSTDKKLDKVSEIDQSSLADKVTTGTLNPIDNVSGNTEMSSPNEQISSCDTMPQNLNISSNNCEKMDSVLLSSTSIISRKECLDSLQAGEAERQNDAKNEMTDLSKRADDSKPALTSEPVSHKNTAEKNELQETNKSLINKINVNFSENLGKDSVTIKSEDIEAAEISVVGSDISGNSGADKGLKALSEKQSEAKNNKKSASELHDDVTNSFSAPATVGLPTVTKFSHTNKDPPDKPGITENTISDSKELIGKNKAHLILDSVDKDTSGRGSDGKCPTVNLVDASNQSDCSLDKTKTVVESGKDLITAELEVSTEVINTEDKTMETSLEDEKKSKNISDHFVKEKQTSTTSEIKLDNASEAKEIMSIDPHTSVQTNESSTTQEMKPEDAPRSDRDKSTDAPVLEENNDSSAPQEIASANATVARQYEAVTDVQSSSAEVEKSVESTTKELDNSSVDFETKETSIHVESSILTKTTLAVTTSCSEHKSEKSPGFEQSKTIETSSAEEKNAVTQEPESIETFIEDIAPVKSLPTKENKAIENFTDQGNYTKTSPAKENKCTENVKAEEKKSIEIPSGKENKSVEDKITEGNNSTEDTKSTETPSTEDKKSTETPSTDDTKSTETLSTEDTESIETPTEDAKSTETPSTEDTKSTETPSTEGTKSTETPSTEDTKSTETPSTEDTKSTETPSTEDTKSTETPPTEDTKSTETSATEDTKSTETLSTEDTKSIETPTEDAKSTETPSTEDAKSTETPATEDTKSTETPSTEDTKSTETPSTEDTKSTETPSTEDTKSTETPSTEDTKSTETPSTEDTKSSETPSTEDTKSTETPSTEDTNSTETSSTEDTKSTETPSTEATKSTETPSTEATKSTETPSTEDTKSTETPSNEDTKSTETPSTEDTKSTETPSTEDTKSTETPSTEDTKSTETPSTEGTKSTETPSTEDTKSTETPSTEDTKSTETPSTEGTKSTETPSEDNKSLETPATEDTISTKISSTDDNKSLEVPATEEYESTKSFSTGDEKCVKTPMNEEQKSMEENNCNEAHITKINKTPVSGKMKSKRTSKKEQSKFFKFSSTKEANSVKTTVSEENESVSENKDIEISGGNKSNTADGKETIAIENITDVISNGTVIENEVVSKNDESVKVIESCNEYSTVLPREPNAAEEISTEKTGRKRPCRSKSANRKTNATKGSKKNESAVTTETANSEHHRNLKRSAPEPGSDEPVDSEPNGKRAKQAAKAQKSRRGRNAAARGRAAIMANCETESEDSETPLSQIRSRRQVKAAGSKEGSSKVSSNQGNKKGSEIDIDENITNGKRAKKKKPGSSSEAVTEEEVTPAKKGRSLTQTSASNKKTSIAAASKGAKKTSPKAPAKSQNEEEEGVRRSQRVRQLKAKRPPTPSSQSEVSEGDEDSEEDKRDQDFFDSSFTPEEESGDEEFKPKGRNFQRQAARTGHVNDEEVVNDDTPCVKCGKYNHPEMILLCDKCDAGYHTACLRPPLMLIPDGDWFCPPCEHLMLITKLLECLQTLDNAMKKKDRLHKRQERLAFVGINISNILHGDRKTYIPGKTVENDKECQENNESDAKDDTGSTESSESEAPKRTFRSERLALRQAQKRSRHDKHKQRRASRKDSPEGEVLTKRTCRLRNAVSYQFKEFDELISNAIEDDKPCRREKPPGIRRGKDMSNILGASDEEDEKIRLRDGDSGGPPPVVKKRTKRKLTKLDSDEDPDEDDESEEFKLSEEDNSSDASEAEEDEDEDASTSNLDSGDWKPKKTWYNSHSPSHRPKRKAKSFVIDDDEYESEENSSKRRSTRNSNRGRIHYNVWDSEDDETEEEQSTSDFCSEDSDSFTSRKKKTKAPLGKNKSGAKAKKVDESDEHSDSSIARRRKLLRKLVKKRRKDTSDSQDTEIESQEKKEKISKKEKSSSEDTDCSATEESEGTDESPKFKKKNVLRSSDEETETEAEKLGFDQVEKPAAAETKLEIAQDMSAQEASIKAEETEVKPEVATKSKARMGPKSKQAKGKKRTEKQDLGDLANVVPSDVPDKVRKVSDEDVERTEEMKSPPAGAKRKPPARRQRGKSKEGPVETAQPEKSAQLPSSEIVQVESQRPVTKKKKVPNFLDVPSGGEESDDQKSNKSQKSSLDIAETTKPESSPAAPPQVEAPANYGNFPYSGQHAHPHHMQYPPNPAHYHPSRTPEDMSSYPQELPTAHAGHTHPPHSRQVTATSGQPPPHFDHPRFPPPHGGMNPMHNAGSSMRHPHPSYPDGANPSYHYQSNMSQGYQSQEPGEVLSQGHKAGTHSNFPGDLQHSKPPHGHVHGVMPQNAGFHMGQQKDLPGGYMQNYGPNRMPLPQEMVPQGRRDLGPGSVRDMSSGHVRESLREMAPGHVREMGPGNVREMGPRHIREMGPGNPRKMGLGNPREMAPGNPREMAPGNPREMAPGNPREMAPGNPREMAPGNPRELGPGNPRELGPGNPRELGPGNPRELGPGNPREMAPGNPREIGPGNPREIGPGNPREMAPGNPREMAPGNMQHPYYGMQPPFHNIHQHYPPHYQGGMPGHPMSSPLNSMGQMTKNLGHEQGMPASTFSNVPSTDGSKDHQKLASPHRQDAELYIPEKGEMSKLKNVEIKEGKRSKTSNKSRPKSKVANPQVDVTDQPVTASKMSKISMGDQDIGLDEKDVPRSVAPGDPIRNPHPGLVGYKSPDQAYVSSGHMSSYPMPYAAHSQRQSMPMSHMPPKHSSFMPPTAHMSSHPPTSGSSAYKTEMGHTGADVKPNIADSKGEISKQNLSPTEQRPNIAYPNVPPMNPAKILNEPPPSHQSQPNAPAMSYPQRFSGPSNVQGPNQMAHGAYYHGPYYHSYGPPPGQAMHPPNTWPQNMPSYGPRMGSPNVYPYGMHPEAMNQGYNMMPKNAPQSTKEAAAANASLTQAHPDTMNTQFSKSLRHSGSGSEEDHPPNVTDKSEGQKSQSASSKDLSDSTKTVNEGELPKDAAIDAHQKAPHATSHLPHRPQPTHSGSSSQSSDAPTQSVPESSSTNVPSGTKQSTHSTITVSTATANSWPDTVHYHQHRGGPWPGMNDPGQFRMMQPYASQGMMGGAHYPSKFQQQPAHTHPPTEHKAGHTDGRAVGGPGPYFQPGYHGFEAGYQPANCAPQLQGQDYSRGPQRSDFNSKQSYKPPAQEDSLNLSADQSQSGDDQSAEANAASKPKRAKTQKKSAKEGGPSGRVRSAKGRGRGRGGFMIDNLLQARGMEGEEEGDDSGEMKDIVSYVTTDDYFKQQTSS